ncbi:2-C-methyl-D-erythritol 4-phosphate cytidylyltransferase [Desulfonatronum sp. SC1]|uniref:2-C-methyl-D-erythritol 4-phosphate cytidylyltransferase n=1 Tax=Desulfonatronum sp. SC1 TaxID=2109626 RepID=UPI000D3234DB|nr:2-C-methyl-D-erythritol 4-phosphate cytidylyltransferase [Desulfonatronum sp. SC1]PTN34900.1 bifunctional 2-C-methyl-D-erythritol 4-phosphate cytidylyltransferase/2-C-methyl-D-erythritol 2,4-cyclodiphosphate synthase [Desulfonatronum sp. SC1]
MKSSLRRPWAVVLAAGQSSRLERAGLGTRKQFLLWRGVPLFWHGVRVFAQIPDLRGVVVVFPDEELAVGEEWVRRLVEADRPGLPVLTVRGGALRQDSVRLGLAEVPREGEIVLIHDAARPFVRPALVAALVAALQEEESSDVGEEAVAGVIPGLPVTDTVKQVSGGRVSATLDRASLRAVQTPQVFDRAVLEDAHRRCLQEQWTVTDDASLVERLGRGVRVIPGDPGNIKITNPDDLNLLKDPAEMITHIPCVGFGYDVHRFGPGRPLKLGGVPFPGAPEIIAHSDGDVLLHALADALLGCLGKGDIGELFPDSDARFENIDSAVLVSEVLEIAQREGLVLTHVDLTVVAQVPKVAPRREEIRRNVARLLGLDDARIGIKASTEEGLGFTGAKQGIKAMAVVTAMRRSEAKQ